jgi:C1A family cysteine protease
MSTNRVLNWRPSPFDIRDLKSTRHLDAPVDLPNDFILPINVPIYDQLDQGSCVSNSACVCYRYEYFELMNSFNFEPSRQYLYYNIRDIEGSTEYDSGAYVRDAFKALSKQGLATEKTWPYKSSNLTIKPSDKAYQEGLDNLVIKYASVKQDLETIKRTIFSGAAISFGFTVFSSFMSGNWDYSSGIMPIPKKNETIEGGHAVTIIGWDDTKKAFHIQNSWGTSWGQQGKFWMPYSFLLDPQIADDFWCIESIQTKDLPTPTPDPVDPVDPTPTPDPTPIPNGCLDPFKLITSYRELKGFSKAFLTKVGTLLNLNVQKKTKDEIVLVLRSYLKL